MVKLSKLTKSTFIILFSKGCGVTLGIILNLAITREYGASVMGEYALFFSTINLISSFLYLGLNVSITKTLPVYIQKKLGLYQPLIKYLKILLVVNIIAIPILYLLFTWFPDFFFTEVPIYFTVLLSTGILLKEIRTFSVSASRGMFKVAPFALEQFLAQFFALSGTIFMIYTTKGHPIIALYFSLLVNAFIFASILFRDLSKYKKGVDQNEELSSFKILRESLPMYGSSVLQNLTVEGNILILRSFTSLEEVSYFAIASRYAFGINIILIAVRSYISPNLAKWKSEGDIDKLFNGAVKATKLITLIVIPLSILLVITTPYLFVLHGEGFEKCYIPFIILLGGFVIKTILGPVDNFLNMTGSHDAVVKINIVVTIVFVLLSILLVPSYTYFGSAIVLAITVVLRNTLASLLIKRKYGRTISYGFNFLNKKK